MGGEEAPGPALEGARAALEDGPEDLELLLVGDPAILESRLPEARHRGHPIRIVPARQTIRMDEPPARAVRRKPGSSIVVGVELQRRGEADAFLSAGSTGAVMAASVLHLGALRGVDRPAVGAVFPTAGTPTLVLDVGANVNCKPRHLHQFAHLGGIYSRDLIGIAEPRIGLLNVGEEAEKGDDLTAGAYSLLREDSQLRFIGNVEGHQIIEGACDVLVCDGFVGNALLKFYESMAGFIVGLLRDGPLRDGGDEGLEKILRLLDYTEYGGAPLLGVRGVCIVCHGASPPRAIRHAIGIAVASVRADMVADMSRDLEGLAAASPGIAE